MGKTAHVLEHIIGVLIGVLSLLIVVGVATVGADM
jgi:hypothetical protein